MVYSVNTNGFASVYLFKNDLCQETILYMQENVGKICYSNSTVNVFVRLQFSLSKRCMSSYYQKGA